MDNTDRDLAFPDGFLWGTATSAHQIEGGNRKNQWWRWEENSSRIADGSKSGRACMHYKFFERDLDLAEILGMNCHRLSIEWSRLEPEPGVFDEEEAEHYAAVLKGLRERELKSFVTLHHFTVPIWFEDAGGWLNPEAPDRFAAFARKVADKLGTLIDCYITLNEPMVVANASYLVGAHPPGHRDENEFAKAAINLLYAHAKAARVIRESVTCTEETKIGITKAITVYEAVDPNNAADIGEKEKREHLLSHWFLECLESGRTLEPLGGAEPVPGLRDSCDFIGISYYLRARVSPDEERMRQYYSSMRGRTEQSDLGWEVYPEGIREAVELAWKIKKPIYITANGIADRADDKRARFIVTHLAELHKAIQDGIDVRGYMHWTLLDDFEWALGYVPKFGLAAITPETYKRVQKRSADVYKEIALTNRIRHEFLSKYLQTEEPAEAPVTEPEPPQETVQEPVGESAPEPHDAITENAHESQPPLDTEPGPPEVTQPEAPPGELPQ